ncbi:MAG: sugar transferase [Scytonema sp. PMC 1069.18]|nr:sugar transferase [Scytonema sp. PMC 1069.18]MEC4882000.1 sugar transferase [Scytonema sp. PMC 1070.18]
MTTSILPTIENYYIVKQQSPDNPSLDFTLQWRQGQLLVMPPGQVKQPPIPSLHDTQLLVECLKHSPVNLVRIDPKLGEAKLKFWADACERADKPIFLRIPHDDHQPKLGHLSLRWLKRLVDWIVAFIFLLALGPITLCLVSLTRTDSAEPLFACQWYIGERGRLFKIFRFRTTAAHKSKLENGKVYQGSLSKDDYEDEQELTTVGRWMRKSGLENLPQLLNVLRGEMSLTGPRCRSLQDAVRLNPEAQRHLNRLPGITGSWELEAESNLLHLDSQIL